MSNTTTKPRRMVSYAKYGYIFIAPFFIVYALFMIWPLINTIILSFFGNGSSPKTGGSVFVGFQNYERLLFGGGGDVGPIMQKEFWTSFGQTLILWVGNFVIQIILSLLFAVWFSDVRIKVPGTGFFKVVMYLPNIITAVSVAGIFKMLFAEGVTSPVNGMLYDMGLISGDPVMFIRGTWEPRILVMFIQSWMWFGNTMLLLLSGIFGIDPSIYEAASIDGSSGMHTFTKITLPILKPIFIYVVITSLIGGLQMFDIPFLLRNGSMYNEHLETAAIFIYNRFKNLTHNGYAAAASVILFIITVILGLIIYKFNSDTSAPKKAKKKKG